MKIALVGEAWGADEALYGKPFIGPSGQELNRMLLDAGLRREDVFVTNVFNFQPQRNDISTLCVAKADAGRFRIWPPLVPGKYLDDRYGPEIDRLATELREQSPNIIVALGNTALWALTGTTAIGKHRGTVSSCTLTGCEKFKVLGTYHPAGILRQYDLRHVAVLDIRKAKFESGFPEIRRTIRRLWIEPTLKDIAQFYQDHILGAERLAFDIETAFGQITCIGFAPSIDLALVIPFVDNRKGGSYWPSLQEELDAWKWVQKILRSSAKKLGQNTLYDIQYLWMKYGIDVANYEDDTMLLHHALHPESEKGLGFLGSVYTNEVSWKQMRKRGEHTIKKED